MICYQCLVYVQYMIALNKKTATQNESDRSPKFGGRLATLERTIIQFPFNIRATNINKKYLGFMFLFPHSTQSCASVL